MASDLLLESRPDDARASGPSGTAIRTLCVSSVERSVPLARRFLRGVLQEWGLAEQQDTAELLLSELVTNAVVHGGAGWPQGRIRLAVACTQRRLTVSVCDEARRLPSPRLGGADDEGGRGLFLVEQLASSWGADATAQGKVVWFRLALNAALV